MAFWEPNRRLWAGRRVLLTGHTGFKGAWLARRLIEAGATVTGLALAPNTTPNVFELLDLPKQLDSLIGTIEDRALVDEAYRRSDPEIVFHLAAQPLVRESYVTPVETFATNVMGTVNVLDRARSAPSLRAMVVITTDKTYRNDGGRKAFAEDDPLGGADPYSASKACAEIVTEAYRRSYFQAGSAGVASARAGNVIGGGDWSADRIVPDIVRAAAAGQPITLRQPRSTRPWQHVFDVVDAYLLLAERLYGDPTRYASAWNFGPDDADPADVETLTRAIVAELDRPIPIVIDPSPQPYEAAFLALDSTKARTELGWRPRFDTTAGVRATAEWYAAWLRGADMQAESGRLFAEFLHLGDPALR